MMQATTVTVIQYLYMTTVVRLLYAQWWKGSTPPIMGDWLVKMMGVAYKDS